MYLRGRCGHKWSKWKQNTMTEMYLRSCLKCGAREKAQTLEKV